jgi:NAD-dependent DNA ligase
VGAFFDFLLNRKHLISPPPDNESRRSATTIHTELPAQKEIQREIKKHFQRRWVGDENEFRRSLGALVGIAQGLVCDGKLSDQEIHYLNDWLANNDAISFRWPGDVICSSVKLALADGVITESERTALTEILQKMIGGSLQTLAAATHVTELAYDDLDLIEYTDAKFCLTGDFVFGTRSRCEGEIKKKGGTPCKAVTKALRYLLVGSLGSPEWKHGSFGSKVEKAMAYKQNGCPILIVDEQCWTRSLSV